MNNGYEQLDTSIEIVTPENVLLKYQLSGPFRRLLAYILDVVIRVGAFLVITLLVGLVFGMVDLAGFSSATSLILYFVLTWFYGGFFEAYWNGQTLGKRALGIRVLTLAGEPIVAWQAFLRNILREIDAMTLFFIPTTWLFGDLGESVNIPCFTYIVGLTSMICTRRFQRLGDLACGTMVVVEQRRFSHGLVKIEEPLAIRLAAELPPNLEVSRSLGQTLALYVERRQVFPAARRADLARHIGAPLCRRFNLPADTSHDLLLCALYYRTFISDQLDEEERPRESDSNSGPVPPTPPFSFGDQQEVVTTAPEIVTATTRSGETP